MPSSVLPADGQAVSSEGVGCNCGTGSEARQGAGRDQESLCCPCMKRRQLGTAQTMPACLLVRLAARSLAADARPALTSDLGGVGTPEAQTCIVLVCSSSAVTYVIVCLQHPAQLISGGTRSPELMNRRAQDTPLSFRRSWSNQIRLKADQPRGSHLADAGGAAGRGGGSTRVMRGGLQSSRTTPTSSA